MSGVVCDRLRADDNLRVMLYCAPTSPLSSLGVEVEFPAQFEVRVNQDEVKFNHKGIKKRPGTTKPADLTGSVRKTSLYKNSLQITYALTTRKYSVMVNLVRKGSALELTRRLQGNRAITKDQVLREMRSKAEDPDIIATSAVMSLKCPISTSRISWPCRSTVCQHNQCFDAYNFLQMQEQAPTWTCPICSKTVSYQTLAMDQYVQEILQKTSAEQVTVEPTGGWSEVVVNDNHGRSNQPRATYDNDDSDDDIVEIPVNNAMKIKSEPKAATPAMAQQTPPLSSREASVANGLNRPGQKRPSAVIDLTLSDDEDEPPRPAKRMNNGSGHASYNTPASMPDVRQTETQQRPQAYYTYDPMSRQHHQTGSSNTLPAPPQPIDNGLSNDAGQRMQWPTGQYSMFSQWRDQQGNYNSDNSPS